MNSKDSKKEISPDIPNQIFVKFLEELKNSEIPTEVIERLEKIILKKESTNEADIKAALFSDI